MPSGITHILLTRYYNDQNKNKKLHAILADARDFFQVGAVAPDLPYSSIADADIFHTETDLADDFHYRNTNKIPLRAINNLKNQSGNYTKRELRKIFSFFLGYASHVIADGLIHPFVRDMVGNYNENKTAHRVLEMRLDVLFYNYYTRSSRGQQFNYSNLHDELMNIGSYGETEKVLDVFIKLIKEVYNKEFDNEKVLGWVSGLHTLFGIAEGHPAWYRNLPFLDNMFYSNYEDLETNKEKLIILDKPVDGVAENFLHSGPINFFEDCVPKFVSVFSLLADKAYNFIYGNGNKLTWRDIPPIDLDTGRPLTHNDDLNLIPTLWRS